MRYVKVSKGVVVAVYSKYTAGLIKADDTVCCGMLYKDKTFSLPPVTPPTIQQQIEALELQQTHRLLREAALGNNTALSMLQEIDSKIQELRDKL